MFAHKFTVVSADRITASTLLLTLRNVGDSRLFTFQPGQYAAISFYRKWRPTPARCFSIVSSPTEQGLLQFAMRVRGHFTSAANKLKPGDTVTVRGPFGGFVFDMSRDHDVVLLAGGIGITPFMSMVRFVGHIHANTPVRLLYSCQTQDDVPFGQELQARHRQNPHFVPIFVIGDGPTDKFAHQYVAQGRITPELLDTTTGGQYTKKTFFICGPPPFMKGMIGILRSKGVPKANIITEAFSQGPNRQTGKIRSWPFNMYVLSAVGLGLSSFVVMVSDLLRALPPSTFLSSNSTIRSTTLTNKRQQDLDALVNEMPEDDSTGGASAGVAQSDANAAANAKQGQAGSGGSAAAATSGGGSSSSSSSGSSGSASTPAPTPTPTPAPAPTPVCTTTPSGVTTCR
jgi:ferredoxin-NADP reductase